MSSERTGSHDTSAGTSSADAQVPLGEDSRKLVTISIPVLNEEDNLERLMERLRNFTKSEPNYRFEFLFTDNASTDRTFEKLAEMANDDPRIRVLRFSRNFGFQQSILTNYLHAKGDAAVQIDADLQDPPELISDFLRAWEGGYKVVYGVRRKRRELFLMNWLRKLYYTLITWLSETDLPRDAGDFRLVDRLILEELRNVTEQTPYLRGQIAQMGYAQKGIVYDRDERKAGRSKFRLLSLIELGLDGITSQSTRPLRLVTIFGVMISVVTFVATIVYLYIYLTSPVDLPAGFTTLVLISLVSLGLNAFFVGLLGEYVGRIFNNTRGLPIAIIESRIESEDMKLSRKADAASVDQNSETQKAALLSHVSAS